MNITMSNFLHFWLIQLWKVLLCSNKMSSMSDGIKNLVDAYFSCIEDHI